MNAIQTIINTATAAHHCAGKLAGYVVALTEAPGNVHGSHAVVVLGGGQLRQLPIQPEAEARSTYYAMVRQMNAASV